MLAQLTSLNNAWASADQQVLQLTSSWIMCCCMQVGNCPSLDCHSSCCHLAATSAAVIVSDDSKLFIGDHSD
jgi:hypothetical protein